MLQENTFQKEFHDACQSGDREVVELLLDRGVLINLTMNDGSTPLSTACQFGHKEVAELLLDRGADINQEARLYSYDGSTPLWIACQQGHIAVVELLIDRGADVNDVNQVNGFFRTTPLFIACQQGHIAVAELLLARGADINQVDSRGKSPLWIACAYGHRAVVELFIDRGADINQAGSDGHTPLSISCARGYLAISKLLISSDKLDGYTPEQLKLIITSCANDRRTGRANAVSFYTIAYQCYKQLKLIGSSYIPNDQESLVIDHGRVQQERQTHTLLSLFFDHRKKRVENVLPKDVWREVTTYLPLSWLRNDDNATVHQSSLLKNDSNTTRNGCSIS